MRELILIAGAALAVSGCGQDQAAENTVNIDSAASVGEISSNDTTAIDAATGADANMAADVDYLIEENEDAGDNSSAEPRRSPRTARRQEAPKPAREDASETGNRVENAE